MAVTKKTLQLEARVRTGLARRLDVQERELVAAWATAWDEVAPELTDLLDELLAAGDGVTRSQLLRSARLTKALAVIADHLDDLLADAHDRIVGDLKDLVDEAGAAQAHIVASQLPKVGLPLVDLDAWSNVDARQISAIVKRATKQITSQTRPLSAESYAAVRRELIRAIPAGANPRETARRMVRRANGRFTGGLNRALTIASTETLDAHRAAAQLGQAQHADVLASWIWFAQLTSRTCPACFGRHGTTHPLSEPGPYGHQRCRCARVPQTKSWKDLGFDLDEPAPLTPDADAYFDSLSETEQHHILGSAGYAAWKAGKWPRSKWAIKQTNDGWRDSWVVAQPPKVKGSRRAA